jgi:siroheme synthase-like protein
VQTLTFPVSLNVRGRRCVLLSASGDTEMNARRERLIQAGALVERIATFEQIKDCDLTSAFLVIAHVRESEAAALFERSKAAGFLLCCIDKPSFSSISMVAAATSGPVTIAISTDGGAPRIAKLLRIAMQRAMDETFRQFVETLAQFRCAVHREHPGPENAERRIGAILERTRGFRADVRLSYPKWFEPATGAAKETGGSELHPVLSDAR